MSKKKEKEDQQKPDYQDLVINKKLVDGSKSRLNEIKDFVEKNEIGNKEENIKNELNNILLEIVHKGSVEQLENYLHWFYNELLVTKKNALIWRRWKGEIKAVNKNVIGMKSLNQPLIEASLKNDYHKVLVFLRNGFKIDDSKFDDYDEWQHECIKPAKERRQSWIRRQLPTINPVKIQKTSSQNLVNFHASSTPAYLLGKYVHDMENLGNPSDNMVPSRGVRDPVSDAFTNAYIAENWISRIENDKNHELQNIQKLKEILETSQKFISEMLNHCETKNEAAQFFSYDSKMKKYYDWDKDNEVANKYPRLNMAIERKYCDIFTHENSQYMLGTKWVTSDHTGQIIKGYSTNLVDMSLRFCLSIILFFISIPFFLMRAVVHSDYYGVSPSLSFDEDEVDGNTSWTNHINHACLMYHFSIPVNRYVGSFISHIIFLILIFLSMSNPYEPNQVVEGINWPDYLVFIWATGHVFKFVHELIYRCKSRNNISVGIVLWLSLDAACFLLILIGLIFKFIGIIQICGTDAIFNRCGIVDPSNLKDDFFVENTHTFFGWGVCFNIIKTLYWSQTFLEIGTLITSMCNILRDCIKVTLVFNVFMFAFSSGMHYIVYTNAYCDEKHRYLETIDNRNTSEITGSEIEKYVIEKVENKFKTFHMSLSTAGWVIMDPGKPETVGCSKSPGRLMWWIYHWITVVYLLNLAIAIMNSTVMEVYKNKIKEWQCARTRVWVSHFNKKFSLPIPFNILEYIVWLLVQISRSNCNKNKTCNDIDVESNHSNTEDNIEEKYNLLIFKLTKNYLENKSN